MAIKSLTITEDAYDALKAMKYGDESFSDVILRLSKEKVGAVAKFFGIWKDKPEVVKEIRQRISERRALIDKEFAERQKRFFGRRA
jgi:predicted CopG family antitoxin